MPSFALIFEAAGAHVSLRDLAVVLCVAAVTTVVFQRLKQPVVLGYLIAGIIVGPYTPGATVRDAVQLHDLSELGMILVLFSIGLEFSVKRVFEMGMRPAFIAAFEGGIMFSVGVLAGRLMGLDWAACLFVGGTFSISSTVLIQRVFHEARVDRHTQDTVMGVLVYEDIAGILLIAGLATLTVSSDLDPMVIAKTGGRLVVFLALVLVFGLLIVPRAVRFVIGLRRSETLLIACLGLCFALSLAALSEGYSTALGAFLAGSLIAESGHGHEVHKRSQPVVDVFAAIFFVAIGMQIDPGLILEHWLAILLLSLVVIVGKFFGVAMGAFLVGEDRRTATDAGLSMTQIGEFGFIIAGIGVASGKLPPWIAAAAVGVSTITAFFTPHLLSRRDAITAAVDRITPSRLQTYMSLYTSWLEDIRAHGRRSERSLAVRKSLRIVFIDALLLAIVVIAGSLLAQRIVEQVETLTKVGSRLALAIVIALGAVACVPFLIGIARGSRAFARLMSEMAMPAVAQGRLDMARAPRAALQAGLQFALLAVLGITLVAVTSPFFPRFATPLVLLVALVPSGWLLWRSATNLEGHVRAGAEIIAEAISRSTPPHGAEPMEEVQNLLPGMGEITMIGMDPGNPSIGQSLSELDIRSLTGANVVVIQRGAQRIVMPNGDERLAEGDVLALTGSGDAIEEAGALLAGKRQSSEEAPEATLS
ncbi:MAG: cation:proton antiporter [Planctomycetes bacterium]|nr:cation:proton antiporter [Planctomycetota bacterium]